MSYRATSRCLKVDPCSPAGPAPGVGASGPLSLPWQSVQNTMLLVVHGETRLGTNEPRPGPSTGWNDGLARSNWSRLLNCVATRAAYGGSGPFGCGRFAESA